MRTQRQQVYGRGRLNSARHGPRFLCVGKTDLYGMEIYVSYINVSIFNIHNIYVVDIEICVFMNLHRLIYIYEYVHYDICLYVQCINVHVYLHIFVCIYAYFIHMYAIC